MQHLDRSSLARLVIAFAAVWHLFSVLVPPKAPPPKGTMGRDFASYYYAVQVAADGGDPYDGEALNAAAQADRTRKKVHPFFYPPPFLLSVAWVLPLELMTGFSIWFWMNELFLGLAVLALWRYLRPLGTAVGPVLALAVALSYGVAYGQELGQANFGVLALVAWALEQQERRPWLAGILLGTACMFKMSPALLVMWWLLRREWVAVAAACGWAVVLSVLSLPLVGAADQLRFYTEVLPQFASGNYNGLTIKIGMFANHSVPNLLDQLWPGTDNGLSGTARVGGSVVSIGLLLAMTGAFFHPPVDRLQRLGQASAVMVLMLLVPVYTYEHHLVFALPALVVATLAVVDGRLGSLPALLLAPCWALWLAPIPSLRGLAFDVLGQGTVGAWFVQESKFGMLLGLLALALWVGVRAPRASEADEAVRQAA
jgi:hypothetical protein